MMVFTHPDAAALVDPLFAFGGKKVTNKNVMLSVAKYLTYV